MDLVLAPLDSVLWLTSSTEFIVVVGGIVSTVQLNSEGDRSLFVELSSAVTDMVCFPSVMLLTAVGLVQVMGFEFQYCSQSD